MTNLMDDIQTEITRLGWSVNRTATLLAVDGVCSSRTASRYLSGKGDTVTATAEAILAWLERQSGDIDTAEACGALASCKRAWPQPKEREDQ